ncbi:MAG: DNA-binding response regulator [Acidimicrobiia bacterium]|nr:DNA-binding response regulator [Acidimicrobiia bacterium]
MLPRLLLADDHQMLRQGLRRSMEDEGFEVVGEAGDGAEAVRMACELRPDVVLMDVSMPEIDGVEATRQIRAALHQARIIMLTMHADKDVIRRAIDAGASGYLVKDCSIDEVVAVVRQVASGQIAVPTAPGASAGAATRPLNERVLTAREMELLQLIGEGLSTPEVAAQLYISTKTVKNHLASIFEKLDARDRTQAVVKAVRMGIIEVR